MARAFDDALGMRRARRNIYAHRALDDHCLVADDKLDLEPGKVRTGADGDMLGVAIVRMLVNVIRLRRLDVLDAAHDGVEILLPA